MCNGESSDDVSNDSQVLQKIVNTILVYRFTRNIHRELKSKKISHIELSEATGRTGNWFNRTFNELEDMRVSTFLKVYAAISRISEGKKQSERNPINLQVFIDEDLIRLATLSLDLGTDDIQKLATMDPNLIDFLTGLRVYIEALKNIRGSITHEEVNAFESILRNLKDSRGK